MSLVKDALDWFQSCPVLCWQSVVINIHICLAFILYVCVCLYVCACLYMHVYGYVCGQYVQIACVKFYFIDMLQLLFLLPIVGISLMSLYFLLILFTLVLRCHHTTNYEHSVIKEKTGKYLANFTSFQWNSLAYILCLDWGCVNQL